MFPDMHNFAKVSGSPRRRSTFLLPFKHCGTINEGALYPFYCQEVLPGDTFNVRTSFVLRSLRTPYVPSLSEAFIDQYYFFCPFRILWAHYEKFVGVAEPDEYTTPATYTLPKMDLTGYPVAAGSVLNGLGLPVGYTGTVSVMPLAAYIKIWNSWFRDENILNSASPEGVIYNAANGATLTSAVAPTVYSTGVAGSTSNTSAARYHDLFSSCLPGIKGGSTKIPLGTTADVVPYGTTLHGGSQLMVGDMNGAFTSNGHIGEVAGSVGIKTGSYTSNDAGIYSTNLVADLSNATAATINDLRLSLAANLYKETVTRTGSRFVEILKGLWGVSPSDARLQRPEFLGGYHGLINNQQVANTSGNPSATTVQSTNKATGSLGGYSYTANSNGTFIKSFEEPGLVIGVQVIRVKHRYCQGVPKLWKKTGKFDFYLPQFDRIGEVPVAKDEIFAGASGTFGFQEAWYEYRHTPDRVSGQITPGLSTDLQSWTYGDYYSSAPTLNGSFITEDKGRIDQNLSGSTSVAQFVFDIEVMNKATRPMSLNSVPSSFGL